MHSGCIVSKTKTIKSYPRTLNIGFIRRVETSLEFRPRYLFQDDLIYISGQPRSLTQWSVDDFLPYVGFLSTVHSIFGSWNRYLFDPELNLKAHFLFRVLSIASTYLLKRYHHTEPGEALSSLHMWHALGQAHCTRNLEQLPCAFETELKSWGFDVMNSFKFPTWEIPLHWNWASAVWMGLPVFSTRCHTFEASPFPKYSPIGGSNSVTSVMREKAEK